MYPLVIWSAAGGRTGVADIQPAPKACLFLGTENPVRRPRGQRTIEVLASTGQQGRKTGRSLQKLEFCTIIDYNSSHSICIAIIILCIPQASGPKRPVDTQVGRASSDPERRSLRAFLAMAFHSILMGVFHLVASGQRARRCHIGHWEYWEYWATS